MKTQKQTAVVGHDVGFRFSDGSWLFKSLEFSFGPGRHGLVGANGAGKSTLARLLVGELEPTSGSLVKGLADARTLYLGQLLTTGPGQTVADELGIGTIIKALQAVQAGSTDPQAIEVLAENWDIEDRAQQSLEYFGLGEVSLDASLETFSAGERMRMRLARIHLTDPKLLILDEPTNHLDAEAHALLTGFIETFDTKSGILIMISHDPALLNEADQIWELSDQGLKRYGGNYDFFLESRREEIASAQERLASAQSLLERRKQIAQDTFVRQLHRIEHGRQFADTGLPKVHRGNMKRQSQETLARVNNRHERLIREAEKRVYEVIASQPELQNFGLGFDVTPGASSSSHRKILVEARDLNFRLPNGELLWRRNLSFDLHGGERFAINGINGAGKTTLLKAIQGLCVPFTKLGTLNNRAKTLATLNQNLSNFDTDETLLELFSESQPGLDRDAMLERLRSFLFSEGQILMPCRYLSGGERVRAALAFLFNRKPAPQLLILDEPNNDLDALSLEKLQQVLADLPCAMIVVSHNTDFIRAVDVDQTFLLERSRTNVETSAHAP